MHTRKIEKKNHVRHSSELLYAFMGKQAVIRIIEQQIFIIEGKNFIRTHVFATIAVEKCSADWSGIGFNWKAALRKKLAENMSDDPVTPERMQE